MKAELGVVKLLDGHKERIDGECSDGAAPGGRDEYSKARPPSSQNLV